MPARRRRSSLREVTSTADSRTEPIEAIHPSASFSTTVRVRLENHPGAFAGLARAIADAGGLLGAIDLVRVEHDTKVRDVTILAGDAAHAEHIVDAIRGAEGVDVLRVSDRTFLLHLGGKIEMNAKSPLKTRDDLSMAYTPGVARVSQAISADPTKAWTLTIKHNAVAVVSDGTAVLGLGDIGPEAAMPVMEGKALLFKEFGGIDAWPICLATKDPDEIVAIVKAIAPGFGGINLEDISAPRCFEIEERLRRELDIPVFHDDQHGTAVVVLAALLNAAQVVGKELKDLHVVLTGVGAAGTSDDAHAARCRRPRRDRLRPARRALPPARESHPEQGGLRSAHEPVRQAWHRRRGPRGRRRLHRPLRPRCGLARGRAHDGRRSDRLRDGESEP